MKVLKSFAVLMAFACPNCRCRGAGYDKAFIAAIKGKLYNEKKVGNGQFI